MAAKRLTVAVTGPTGTFGAGFVPLLQSAPQVRKIVGLARRPFDPAERGWTKMTYREGDVRNEDALATAFRGADVVVHLAFAVSGAGSRQALHEINVDGTLNVFRAAVRAGVRRFVYASSVAAYGFKADNPDLITESQPVRPSVLFYAQEKAELDRLLSAESRRHPGMELYVLRPPLVVGPHAIGAKAVLPDLPGLGRLTGGQRLPRSPVPLPVPAPRFPLQLIHEDDVGRALLLCTLGAGRPGAYNIAADDVVTTADMVREAGFLPVPVPTVLARTAAAATARLPLLPPAARWVEALSHPVLMDTTKAKQILGWEPRHTAREALRSSFR